MLLNDNSKSQHDQNFSPGALSHTSQNQALFDLRRENFALLSDKRKLEVEIQMLKATADGGEQRVRER